jgi:hypothetical protein
VSILSGVEHRQISSNAIPPQHGHNNSRAVSIFSSHIHIAAGHEKAVGVPKTVGVKNGEVGAAAVLPTAGTQTPELLVLRPARYTSLPDTVILKASPYLVESSIGNSVRLPFFKYVAHKAPELFSVHPVTCTSLPDTKTELAYPFFVGSSTAKLGRLPSLQYVGTETPELSTVFPLQ